MLKERNIYEDGNTDLRQYFSKVLYWLRISKRLSSLTSLLFGFHTTRNAGRPRSLRRLNTSVRILGGRASFFVVMQQ